MQAIKFPVLVVLVLAARICRAKVVIAYLKTDRSTSDLLEDLVTIVTSCYGDRIHGIGLAGDLPDGLLRTLSTQHSIPVALMDNTKRHRDDLKQRMKGYVRPQFRQKLDIFIVKASSFVEFRRTLSNIKYSIWWNNMASFIILDLSPGCKMDHGFLTISWKLGVLNANVMCHYGGKIETVIETYNPFTSQAPVPWKKLNVVKGKYGHPFTIFRRKLRDNVTMCLNLDFNKVNDCGGHQIDVCGYPTERIIKKIENRPHLLASVLAEDRIFDTVYRALNITPRHPGTYASWLVDICRPANWVHSPYLAMRSTYPHGQNSMVLLSQFRGNKSQLQKILGVIDTNCYIGLGITYLITLIFFKFIVCQTLVPAILNLIRISCAAAFANVPRDNPPRIYLAGILFLAVTMHGIFEGNLASLLTTVIPLRNINTMNDLIRLDCKLYYYDHKIKTLDPENKDILVFTEKYKDCITKVRDDESSACLGSAVGEAFDDAKNFNLHLGDKFNPYYLAFMINWNWPYEEQFNIIISRMVEADVLEPWIMKCNPVRFEDLQIDNDVKQNKVVKVIELHELTFAFVILGIGLALATITFIAELGIHYVCRHVDLKSVLGLDR